MWKYEVDKKCFFSWEVEDFPFCLWSLHLTLMRFSPPPYFPLSRLSLSLENPIPRKLSNSGWVHCTNGRNYPWNYSKHMQPRNIVRYGGVFAPPIFPSESKVLWSPVDPASSYCWIIPPPPSVSESLSARAKTSPVVPRIWAEVVLFVPLPIPPYLAFIEHTPR